MSKLKYLLVLVMFWANNSLAYVKFEPVIKLFNNDPALDISYHNFDRRSGDIDVDEYVDSYSCNNTYVGDFDIRNLIGFAAKGF